MSKYFWYVCEKFAYKYVVTSRLFADSLPIIHCLLGFSSQYTRVSSVIYGIEHTHGTSKHVTYEHMNFGFANANIQMLSAYRQPQSIAYIFIRNTYTHANSSDIKYEC